MKSFVTLVVIASFVVVSCTNVQKAAVLSQVEEDLHNVNLTNVAQDFNSKDTSLGISLIQKMFNGFNADYYKLLFTMQNEKAACDADQLAKSNAIVAAKQAIVDANNAVTANENAIIAKNNDIAVTNAAIAAKQAAITDAENGIIKQNFNIDQAQKEIQALTVVRAQAAAVFANVTLEFENDLALLDAIIAQLHQSQNLQRTAFLELAATKTESKAEKAKYAGEQDHVNSFYHVLDELRAGCVARYTQANNTENDSIAAFNAAVGALNNAIASYTAQKNALLATIDSLNNDILGLNTVLGVQNTDLAALNAATPVLVAAVGTAVTVEASDEAALAASIQSCNIQRAIEDAKKPPILNNMNILRKLSIKWNFTILEDCVVSDWSDWSACVNCGTQTQTQQVLYPGNGGAACPTNLTNSQSCPCNSF